MLVEDAREGALDDVLVLLADGLEVDVEEDGLARYLGAAAGRGKGAGVLELVREVINRRTSLDHPVGQEVREHLEEVGLARAEEARDPDADLVRGLSERSLVGTIETLEMTRKLVRDHVLGELLLKDVLIRDVHLDDAVNIAIDITFEHACDFHEAPFPLGPRA